MRSRKSSKNSLYRRSNEVDSNVKHIFSLLLFLSFCSIQLLRNLLLDEFLPVSNVSNPLTIANSDVSTRSARSYSSG